MLAYASICQHKPAYAGICWHMLANARITHMLVSMVWLEVAYGFIHF